MESLSLVRQATLKVVSRNRLAGSTPVLSSGAGVTLEVSIRNIRAGEKPAQQGVG